MDNWAGEGRQEWKLGREELGRGKVDGSGRLGGRRSTEVEDWAGESRQNWKVGGENIDGSGRLGGRKLTEVEDWAGEDRRKWKSGRETIDGSGRQRGRRSNPGRDSSSESTLVQDALVLSPLISPSCAQHTMNVPPGGVYVPCIHSHAR